MKNKKIISSIVLIISILIFGVVGVLYNSIDVDSNTTNSAIENNFKKEDDILKVYYFNVGNADCTLLIFNNNTMLIDGANEADSSALIKYMKELGITKLDYVIATHSDEDHIAGLDKIIDAFELGTFYMPIIKVNSEPNKDKELKELIASVNRKGQIENPNINYEFAFGEVKCLIKWIADSTKVNSNKSSVVLEATYKENRFLFMGDYEPLTKKEREIYQEYNIDIEWNNVDVVKVAHHGSKTNLIQNFYNLLLPKYAIISAGIHDKNTVPDKEVTDAIEAETNAVILITKEFGTILIESDGKDVNLKEPIKNNFDGNR